LSCEKRRVTVSLKPICIPCQRFFRVKKSGFYFTEGMPIGDGRAAPGTTEPEKWKPYKIWSGDRWECEGCGAQIVSGVGLSPISVQHKTDFNDYMKSLGADQFQVNDC
jgi:hypothetical protein